MSTQAEARLRDRKDRLEALGLGHPDNEFYGHIADLTGVGVLTKADARSGRLQVEIEANGVVFYLDTTNPRCADDLYNLPQLDLGTRVAVSGSLRSMGSRGVRLGRLSLLPCDAPFERVVFRPSVRANGLIRLGEGEIPDPDSTTTTFNFVSVLGVVAIIPVPEG